MVSFGVREVRPNLAGRIALMVRMDDGSIPTRPYAFIVQQGCRGSIEASRNTKVKTMPPYEPNGRARVHGFKTKEVTSVNLIQYLSESKEDSHHFAHVISAVYKFDAPWTYHLKRCIDASGGVTSFRSTDWATAFIREYVAAINKAEQIMVEETGSPIGLQVR
jgi:hypothetical protein